MEKIESMPWYNNNRIVEKSILYSVKFDYIEPDNIIHTHWHDYIEFQIITAGRGIVNFNGTEYWVERGDTFILSHFDCHRVMGLGEGLRIATINVAHEFLDNKTANFLNTSGGGVYCKISEEELEHIIFECKKLKEDMSSKSQMVIHLSRIAISSITLALLRKNTIPSGNIPRKIQKITSYLNPAILDQIAHIESYISTQVIPEDLSLYRVEGYYGGGNSYGCLGSITLTNGKTLDVALEEAVAGGEDAIKAMEKSISMGELDLETGKFKKYVAVNERFTSTRLLKSGNGSAGSGKVVWEFNIKKGSKAVFMEGNNITGSLSGECEVILQKDSQFIITEIKYDKNIKKWVVKADVVN